MLPGRTEVQNPPGGWWQVLEQDIEPLPHAGALPHQEGKMGTRVLQQGRLLDLCPRTAARACLGGNYRYHFIFPWKKKNNHEHLQLQLITADCVAAAQVPGNQETGDNAVWALFSAFPPPYLNLKPSWPCDGGSRVCKHPTQPFSVFLYQAAGLRQSIEIATYFLSPEVRPSIPGPPGPSQPIPLVHASFTR